MAFKDVQSSHDLFQCYNVDNGAIIKNGPRHDSIDTKWFKKAIDYIVFPKPISSANNTFLLL